MKLLFSFATIFMFLGFTVGSYGDNHSIQAFVYVTSKQTEPLAVGDQMHLNIQISGGKSVSGYEMIVGFDPTALRYIEGANADYLPAGAFTIPPIVTENAVYMTATSGAEVASASKGILATLTFEVIAAKDSTIKLMDVILSDSAGMPLAVTVRNGRIRATELPTNWDVNEDGKVNILDLTLVASDLNVDAPANPRVDVNRDGNVNILDLVLVAQNLDAGSNEDKPELRVKLVVPTFASLVSAIPASGDLAFNGSITVTFSSDPGDVTASAGTVSGSGKVRTIAGPFTLGALSLTSTWTNGDGSHTLTYNVTAPDTKAPTITGGTISDGAEDVDPEPLNADGIEVIFSEDVSGNIALQTEAGDDVGWIGRVEGTKGTLEPVVGKEIGHETTYVIKGKVFDAVGNETDVSITFTTKGKE